MLCEFIADKNNPETFIFPCPQRSKERKEHGLEDASLKEHSTDDFGF